MSNEDSGEAWMAEEQTSMTRICNWKSMTETRKSLRRAVAKAAGD